MDGGQKLCVHMVRVLLWGFVCLFFILERAALNLTARLIYIAAQRLAFCNEFPVEMEISLLIT